MIEYGSPPTRLGDKTSDKTKLKIRRSHIKRGVGFVKNSKPIRQYTLKGKYLCSWRNAKEVEVCLSSSNKICVFRKVRRQLISRCARGERKSAYGFIWKYV